MASKFFRGFSKVFKGPNNRDGFKRPTKYATIGGVKPKAKVSDATKKFKAKVEATKKAIKKGTDDFKKELGIKKADGKFEAIEKATKRMSTITAQEQSLDPVM